jgi:hypothetical protein
MREEPPEGRLNAQICNYIMYNRSSETSKVTVGNQQQQQQTRLIWRCPYSDGRRG